jgi:hypothetical protein
MSDNQYIAYYCYPRMHGLKRCVLKEASSAMNVRTRPNMGSDACIQSHGDNASERVVTIGAGLVTLIRVTTRYIYERSPLQRYSLIARVPPLRTIAQTSTALLVRP